jgi:hypothetical protein
MLSPYVYLGLQCIQLLFTLLTTSLVGNILYDGVTSGSPHAINFALFADVFAWLSLLSLLLVRATGFPVWSAVPLLLDACNTVFWFIASVALTVTLGGAHSCLDERYTRSNIITSGTVDPEKTCREAQAATAFFWFATVAFALGGLAGLLAARGKLGRSRVPGETQGLDWYTETKA